MAGVLQHLRSSTLNKRPNPASMVDGQIAINYASGSPGAFFKDTNGNLVKVGPVHVGATAPNVSPASGGTAGNSLGEQWLDTSGGTYVFKIWDGAAWRSEAGEFVNSTGDTMTGSLTMGPSANLIFEGSTDDGFETTLTVVDPTADRTITLPNVSGTVVTTGDSGTVTSAMIADGTIVNADVNASAAIAGTKISPDFGSQTIQTTGVFSHSLGSASSPTVTFTGDTNTGIYSPGADQVAISTGGSGRLFVDASGRVGVNTSTPERSLGVWSATNDDGIQIRNTSTAASVNKNSRLQFVGTDTLGTAKGTANIYCLAADQDLVGAHLSFWTRGSDVNAERLRITSAGNVGIGTTSPNQPLHVVGNARFTASLLWAGASTTNSYVDGATAGLIKIGSNDRDRIKINPTEITFNDATSEFARIDSSGRLLVGTSSARTNFLNTNFLSAAFQVEGTGHNSSSISLVRNENDVYAPYLNIGKTRGTGAGQNTVVQNNDVLGVIAFQGADGSDLVEAASIAALVDGTPGANDMPGRIVFSTTADGASSPTERMRITSAGNVGIGTASPAEALVVEGKVWVGNTSAEPASTSDRGDITITNDTGPADILFLDRGLAATRIGVDTGDSGNFKFVTDKEFIWRTGGTSYSAFNTGSERARIDSSGRFLVGTSSNRTGAALQVEGTTFGTSLGTITNNSANSAPAYFQLIKSRGTSVGSQALVSNGDGLGNVQFVGTDGTQQLVAAAIEGIVDGTPGANDMPGRLVFSTTADGASSPTERMRISNAGHVFTGGATSVASIESGAQAGKVLKYGTHEASSGATISTIAYHWSFANTNGFVGSISTSGSATAYNTSSDYRLKENVTAVIDGITRLQQLKPSRFNFIADPAKTVDGFIAHEVQAIVPEAITGEKDAVDDQGNPIYQGIDQSKLVPLLTAALQEAIGEIESLKARLTAAGI